jgi:DDE superfamily endonuclease
MNENGALEKSVQDLRDLVARAFPVEKTVLLNLIDALVVGPRPASAVEATLSPVWSSHYSNLYAGIERVSEKLAGDIAQEDWLQSLRKARLDWLAQQSVVPAAKIGNWRVRILDASDYPRPKTKTVPLGYVHSAEGMRLGHGLSLLSERVGEGSWTLPLEIGWIPPKTHPNTYGVVQLEEFVRRHGWPADYILDVDAGYTNEPFLRPVHALGIPILGRVAANRAFYLPPPPYGGIGRPSVRGRKFKLNDARTLPPSDEFEQSEIAGGGRLAVSRWNDIRMKKWPEQRLVLYRVIEYRADGKQRYRRPLWLIYVPAELTGEVPEVAVPAPLQAAALYQERFPIEHSIRFMKGELGLIAGQFNGDAAEGRVQVWVELVASALWFLWAMLGLAKTANKKSIPGWWNNRKLTPGAVRRMAPGLLLSLGWKKPQSKLRGKSLGRAKGTVLEPRKRFKPVRKAI